MPGVRFSEVETPIGTFRVVFDGREVSLVDLLERGRASSPIPEGARRMVRLSFEPNSPPRQLKEYFDGKRTVFDVDLDLPDRSAFDRTVWTELAKVPAGEVVTYGGLARRAGFAGAARAVGGSMHRNPIPIIVPCHRVVGESGLLTGFGLGLWRKRWLLGHEGVWPIRSRTPDGPPDPHQMTLDPLPRVRARPRGTQPA